MSEADVESELDSYQATTTTPTYSHNSPVSHQRTPTNRLSSRSTTPTYSHDSFVSHQRTPTNRPSPLTNRHSTPIKQDNQSASTGGSPRYTLSPDDDDYTDRYTWTPDTELTRYSTPKKSVSYSQRTSGKISRESGRRSPTEITERSTVQIGSQPLTLPRFNEPLKQLRKRRQFVDYESPVPTVVYVPHRARLHGSRANMSVQRNPDGRFVVIEQRPVATMFTGVDPATNAKDADLEVYGARVGWTKKKPPWNRSLRSIYMQRQINQKFFEPFLPPVKAKYVHVPSKVESMENLTQRPERPVHKIPSFRLKWEAESKVGSLPSTERGVEHQSNKNTKLPELKPRFGASADSASFNSIHYTPGGNVVIKKRDFDVKSRIGSLDNVGYQCPESAVKIPSSKLSWSGNSKVGSMENVMHMPKRTNIQIFREKLDWQSEAKVRTMGNVNHQPRQRKFRPPHFNQIWGKHATSSVNSLTNLGHKPRGRNVQIISEKLNWDAKAKIETRWGRNYEYQSLFDGSDTNSLAFTDTASYPYTM